MASDETTTNGSNVISAIEVDGISYNIKDSTARAGIESLSSSSSITLDDVYPVGSIYMSVNSTSPDTLFGGTWQRIYGQFLLGASSAYTAGSTGGEATHTLTKDELPKHRHPFGNMDGDNLYAHLTTDGSTASDQSGALSGSTYKVPHSAASATYTHRRNTDYTGSGAAHNNMPPYLVVYMWKRTA